MSLASWICERFAKRRPKRALPLRGEDVVLYLRRLEDRRVLTGAPTAIDDAYFVEDASMPLVVSGQLGVLSNDQENGQGPLQAVEGNFTTDLGGTLDLNADGSFTYIAPTDLGPLFVDTFFYTADNGTSFTNAALVTFYVGDVPVNPDQSTLLPIFGVEYETPADFVQVDLTSSVGASLTLLDTTGVTFDFGANGQSEISISGTASDVNRALDSLEYRPPELFSGYDSLAFDAQVFTGGEFPEQTSQLVPVYVFPSESECGCEEYPPSGIVTQPDQYYVPPFQSGYFVPSDAGVLDNDFSEGEYFLYVVEETITTDLGGTVEMYFDGSFFYTPPTEAGPTFVDSFTYFASNEISTVPGEVTLFVGEIPVPEDTTVPLPLFNVPFGMQSEMVTVNLATTQGGRLTLLDTSGISFLAGANGGTAFTITGFYDDVNFALDTLQYRSALNFSGLDFVNFNVEFPGFEGQRFMQQSNGPELPPLAIRVLPVADAPVLSIAPQPVIYQPGVPTPVSINTLLTDVDGSEIRGLVILDFVPPGVVPSVGQQLANDPKVYLILPSDLPNLTFTIDASAPLNFNIVVIATSIETTKQPGVFGGPGGPLLPMQPFDPRFATTSMLLTFVRLGSEGLPPVGPPPPRPGLFFLGPLLANPQGEPISQTGQDQGPQQTAPLVAFLIEAQQDQGFGGQTSGTAAFGGDSVQVGGDGTTAEQQSDEQGRTSSESTGIFLRKLGGDSIQTAKLPAELAEDYSRFIAFLKTLPNGDYVIYFKRGGQSHDEAEVRQVVVKVRVVNHRLNPDSSEFKPAGEVAEPLIDPNADPVPATVNAPTLEERAEGPADEGELSGKIAAGLALIAGWKLHGGKQPRSASVDCVMEHFPKKPALRFYRRQRTHHS